MKNNSLFLQTGWCLRYSNTTRPLIYPAPLATRPLASWDPDHPDTIVYDLPPPSPPRSPPIFHDAKDCSPIAVFDALQTPQLWNASSPHLPYIIQRPDLNLRITPSDVVRAGASHNVADDFKARLIDFANANIGSCANAALMARFFGVIIPEYSTALDVNRGAVHIGRLDRSFSTFRALVACVTEVTRLAHEAQGFTTLVTRRVISHVAEKNRLPCPSFGLDNTMVGAIVLAPLDQKTTCLLEQLGRDGVPCFAIQPLWERLDTRYNGNHRAQDEARYQAKLQEHVQRGRTIVSHVLVQCPGRRLPHYTIKPVVLPADGLAAVQAARESKPFATFESLIVQSFFAHQSNVLAIRPNERTFFKDVQEILGRPILPVNLSHVKFSSDDLYNELPSTPSFQGMLLYHSHQHELNLSSSRCP